MGNTLNGRDAEYYLKYGNLIDAPPAGIGEVADDPSPELGGDLELGPHNIVGTLENDTFTIDGGLL